MKKIYKYQINQVKNLSFAFILCLMCSMGTAEAATSVIRSATPLQQIIKQKRVTIKLQDKTLDEILMAINKESNIGYTYQGGAVDKTKRFSLNVTNVTVEEALNQLLEKSDYTYRIENEVILIYKKEKKAPEVVKVKGKVIGDNKKPITGATIILLNQTKGAISNDSGEFELTANAGDSLEVSYVGYKTKFLSVTPHSVNLVIALQEDVLEVEDVVVTGMFERRTETFTGAYEVLGKKDFDRRISTNITEALEGQAAGVSTYGDKIVVRGVSTFSSNIGSSPLIVVDGMPTEMKLNDLNMNDVETITVLKDAASASIYGVRAANGVIVITTKKVAKGRTDVVFTSDFKFTQNPSLSDYHLASSGDIIDYEQALINKAVTSTNALSEKDLLLDHLKGIGEATSSSNTLPYYSPYRYARTQYLDGQMSERDFNAAVKDWKATDYRREYTDLVWQMPVRQSYNLSVNSGSERQSTYASINFINNGQQIRFNKDRDMKGYFKSTQNITKWFSFDIGADIQYSNNVSVDSNYSNFNTLEPYTRIMDENGNKVYRDYVDISRQTYTGGLHINPKIIDQIDGLPQFMSYKFNIMDELDDNKKTSHNYTLRSFAKFNLKIYKDLKFSTSFSYEFAKGNNETFMSEDSYYIRFLRNRFANYNSVNSVIPEGGRMAMVDTKSDNWVSRSQFDYNKIKGNHEISISAGAEFKQIQGHMPNTSVYYGYNPTSLSYTLINAKDMNSNVLKQSYIYNNNTGIGALLDGSYNTLADNELKPSLSSYRNRYVGLYAVGNYTYKNRYGVSGSIRMDQANLFGTDPKYRYRPLWSVGAKWNVNREDFMQNVEWVNVLSLRASYGLTGNVDQTTTPYLVASMYNQSIYTGESIPYTNITTAPNPLLRWERTRSFDIGIDFALLAGTLSGTIDYYHKKSDDLLAPIEVPFSSGFVNQKVNYGAMINKGVEVSLSSTWLRRGNWALTSSLMMSYNHNEVTQAFYNPTNASQLISSTYYQLGKPLSAIYAYQYGGLTSDGTEAQNGVPIIRKADGSTIHTYNADGNLGLASSSTMKPEDLIYMGSGTPPWNGAFTQNIRFRNWELNAMFTYYGGHKVYVPSYDFYQTSARNDMPDWVSKAWSPQNTSSKIPKSFVDYDVNVDASNVIGLREMYQKSTENVANGDFIRLRTLSLAYTLPRKIAELLKMKNLKITGQVNNPCFWSAAGDGIDPETLTRSGEWTLPTPTTYFLKLDITF